MKHFFLFFSAIFGLSVVLWAQPADIRGTVGKTGEKPAVAVADMRGTGAAQAFMDGFNRTLYSELQDSGRLKMIPKTVYPLTIPQQPSDFHQPHPWLSDWSGPPVSANYLAFGYTAVQGNQLVLFGWFYDVSQQTTQSAQVIGKLYFGSLDQTGAIKVARDFAADILKQFGAISLAGTKIYYVSGSAGNKEIWSMDYDGSNPKPFTSYRSITTFPAVSGDGTKIAFTTYARGLPSIFVHSLDTGRKLPFYNQNASMSAASDFMPDSKHLLIYSTAAGGFAQIFMSDVDGSNLRRLSHSNSIDVEPKVNPKTGADLVFISGRSGPPQVYRMSIDGTDVVRLTDGTGECANPSWSPDGQHIAFAWTRGFEPGNFNIFVMDVGNTQNLVQLTHGAGRNENPSWAPDGIHIVFSSRRGRSTQIYTMLADGSGQKQLTFQGNNEKPVWSKATQ